MDDFEQLTEKAAIRVHELQKQLSALPSMFNGLAQTVVFNQAVA